MADVALISVISSGVVGVLGGASGFYGQRVALFNEKSKRREAHREDLRTVLAEAAGAAMAWNRAAGQLEKAIAASAAVMDQVTTDMQLHRARLGVRVGPNAPVFVAFKGLQQAIQELENALRKAPPDLTLDDVRNPVALDDTKRASAEAIGTLSESVYAAMDRFLAASANLIGAST